MQSVMKKKNDIINKIRLNKDTFIVINKYIKKFQKLKKQSINKMNNTKILNRLFYDRISTII